MTHQIIPPLAAHFIWHPDDEDAIFPVICAFRRYLTRDIERPFSRELNIPTFLYSTRQPLLAPITPPAKLAQRDVVFLFLSTNTLMNEAWKNYIDNLPAYEGYAIVPVAIEREGQQHALTGRLKNLNFIRAFDWLSSPLSEQYSILMLSHELYRYGLNDIAPSHTGIESSIKLFLSHAKKGDTGLKHAESIKRFLDNSNMKRFFDANEISPGFRFDNEIENHIKNSTIIAIASDAYSSRYWCQREILCAKRERRPIILVNSLEHYEDRVFPAASNIPCVHITAEPLDEKNILRILIAALLETIRFRHAHKLLKYYQNQGWIDKSAQIFARPPEIQQIVDLVRNNDEKISELTICYPEPPLYKEETDWTDYFKLTVSTPLWSSKDNELNMRIGLSISDYSPDGYERHNQNIDELKRFSQSLVRHLLARNNKLIYGGDLRDDGFTQFILEEATVLRDRLQVDQLYVENYLAWPLHTKKENMRWYANYSAVVKPHKVAIPADIRDSISNPDSFLEPNCPENRYIWSRCLTKMRQQSVASSDVRILAGGKLENYLGKMPGLLEEFIIAYESHKPIYLVGGLGGLVKLLCNSINEKKITDDFTDNWQTTHNSGYEELQNIAKRLGHHADYQKIRDLVENIDLTLLAARAGLSIEDYQSLMNSPFVDESIHLILKGLRAIKNRGAVLDN
ncbi:TIR domain-containing protein [Neisseria dentiae]